MNRLNLQIDRNIIGNYYWYTVTCKQYLGLFLTDTSLDAVLKDVPNAIEKIDNGGLPPASTDTPMPKVKPPAMMRCSFCHKLPEAVEIMIAGPTPVNICDQCVDDAMAIVIDKRN